MPSEEERQIGLRFFDLSRLLGDSDNDSDSDGDGDEVFIENVTHSPFQMTKQSSK